MSLPGLTAATIFCGAGSTHWNCSASYREGGLELQSVTVNPLGPVPAEVATVLGATSARELRAGGGPLARSVIEGCRMVLRARFSPGLRSDDERARVMLSIADATDGLLFDGRVVRDAHGIGLLSVELRTVRPIGRCPGQAGSVGPVPPDPG